MHNCNCQDCRRTSSAVPGEIPAPGSYGTLRGPDGLVVNGSVVQQDYLGYVVETPEGTIRVPYGY